MIKYILLGYLNYKPMTGYELKQSIDSSTAHFWHAHHSQIYTTLRQMEKDGLLVSEFISEEGQPSRRVYTITGTGREELGHWLDQPMLEITSIKEDFLVRIFFSGRRDPQKVLTELRLQLELHRQKMGAYQALEIIEHKAKEMPMLRRDAFFWQATLDMGIRYEKLYIEWLEDTIRMVETLD